MVTVLDRISEITCIKRHNTPIYPTSLSARHCYKTRDVHIYMRCQVAQEGIYCMPITVYTHCFISLLNSPGVEQNAADGQPIMLTSVLHSSSLSTTPSISNINLLQIHPIITLHITHRIYSLYTGNILV